MHFLPGNSFDHQHEDANACIQMNPNNIVGNIIICTKADNCYLSCNQISIVSHQTCLNLYFCAVQEINKR